MAMAEVLREKRKALGLTQEQVANYLGITTPAVNKWEKGLSCPDLTLLPVLARLLKTDPNTLLGFQENLSDLEVTLFLNDVAQHMKDENFLQAFSMAMEKVREYPQCAGLQYSVAMVLEGGLLMTELSDEDRERCQTQITELYERVAQSDDLILSNSARYSPSFISFLAQYLNDRTLYAENHGPSAKPIAPPPNLCMVGMLPWVSFTHYSPVPYQQSDCYFPVIEAGKFFEQNGRTLMPLSVMAQHAVADGYHTSTLFNGIQAAFLSPQEWIDQ